MSNESLELFEGDILISPDEEEDVKDYAYYEHMNHIKLNEDSI